MCGEIKNLGAKVSGFIDDNTLYISGKAEENAKTLSNILKKRIEWTSSRSTKIDLSDKLRFLYFIKKSFSIEEIDSLKLVLPDGSTRKLQRQTKLLVITLDTKLSFRSRTDRTTRRAQATMAIIYNLGGFKTGMIEIAVRSMYLANHNIWYRNIQTHDERDTNKKDCNCLEHWP